MCSEIFGDAGSPFGDFLICFLVLNLGDLVLQPKRDVDRKRKDIHVVMNLRLEEILYDVKKIVEYNRYVICESCKGTGAENGTNFETCPRCNGEGNY